VIDGGGLNNGLDASVKHYYLNRVFLFAISFLTIFKRLVFVIHFCWKTGIGTNGMIGPNGWSTRQYGCVDSKGLRDQYR
jgi:hypothetical protein